MIKKFKDYYQLTKPGIIYGNAVTAIAGFLLASQGHPRLGLFLATIVGLSLVIASGCVLNNYIDRDIDKKMARTKNRALAIGLISERNAFVYAITLGVAGIFLLINYTNDLTTLIAIFGLFAYVVLYGIAKRKSVWGTVVGSISGAVPPVVGYLAVTNNFDLGAGLLFLILVCWQMPHFYAIAIFRSKEYASAAIPVLPIKKGLHHTQIQMVWYILAFTVSCLSLTLFGYTGYSYLIIMTITCLLWLKRTIEGFRIKDSSAWARQVFGFSLVTLMVFSLMISINNFLP